jgi:flagellar hook-length control protein FliK
MNAMPALAAVAAAPARGAAAPADGPGTEGTDATGGFADALELARDPRAGAKASGKSELRFGATARTAPAIGPQAAIDADKEPGPAQANIDVTMPPEAIERAAEPAAPDLSALLPGWPIAPTTVPVAAAVAAAGGSEAPIAAASPTPEALPVTVAPAVAIGIAKNAFEIADKTRPMPTTADGKPRDEGHEKGVRPALPAQANANAVAAVAKTAPQGQPSTPAVAIEPAPPATPALPATPARPVHVESGNPAPSGLPAANLNAPMPTVMPPAQATAPAQAAGNPMPPPFEARLNTRLDSPSFAPALAHQVTWLVNEGVQQARLALNPAEMGPVTVRIVLDGSQARIEFSAELPATRAAIEASLPNLAASLHDNGLTLAGGGVSDGQQARHHGARNGHHAQATGRQAGTENAETGLAAPSAAAPRAVRGLVDLVA